MYQSKFFLSKPTNWVCRLGGNIYETSNWSQWNKWKKNWWIRKNCYTTYNKAEIKFTWERLFSKIEKYQQKEHLNNFNITLNNEIQINIDISKLNNNIPTATKGIVRTIDQLGRIIIPMQLRKDLGIKEKDSIKICYKDNMIILIKKEYDNHNRRKQNFNHNRRWVR